MKSTYTASPANSDFHQKLLDENGVLSVRKARNGRPGHVRIERHSRLALTTAYEGHRDLIPFALRTNSRLRDPNNLLTSPDTSD